MLELNLSCNNLLTSFAHFWQSYYIKVLALIKLKQLYYLSLKTRTQYLYNKTISGQFRHKQAKYHYICQMSHKEVL